MLSYNQITPKTYIIYEGTPYEVLSSNVFRKQKRKPVNQTKLKNLITGKVIEHSFHQSDKVEEAELETKKIKYLYTNLKKREYLFSEVDDPKERFSIPAELAKEKVKFIKENSTVEVILFQDPSIKSGQSKIISLKVPIKVELKVVETPPGIKGDTATGGTKQATLETDMVVNVPLFIKEGDIIRINTDTGEYVERV